MSQSVVPMRPLGVGDLFDGSIRLFRQHFGRLLVLSLIVYIPFGVIGIVIGSAVNEAARTGSEGGLIAAGALALAAVPIYVLGTLVSFGATITMARLGRRLETGQALRRGLRRFWPMLGLQLVYLIAITLLFVTIIGIPFALYFGITQSGIATPRPTATRRAG